MPVAKKSELGRLLAFATSLPLRGNTTDVAPDREN
jgi:hypothetical protein